MSLHPHTQQLADFYTQSAHKRHHTRRRPWPEFAYIAEYINQLNQTHLTIIELGCGDGRLYEYLRQHCKDVVFNYIGVDVSEGLIALAQTHYPDAQWICEEMNEYLESRPQQSCDLVIAIASIQHLPTPRSQELVFHEMYKVLNYDGSVIMTNRSLSQWFISRYRLPVLKSIGRAIMTLGYHHRRSMMIPFRDGEQLSYRFYHLFSRSRLQGLLQKAGFMLQESSFVDAKGNKSLNRIHSRNHYHVARKQVRSSSLSSSLYNQ